MFGLVPLDEGICKQLAGFPRQSAGQSLGVDGVEVATGGQDVHQTAHGGTRRARLNESAIERVQDLGDFPRGLGQAGHNFGAGELKDCADGVHIGAVRQSCIIDDAVDGLSVPACRIQCDE